MIGAGRTRGSMDSFWSPEVRIMLNPVSAYRELAEEAEERREIGWVRILKRILFLALFLGGIVSLTSSGRLTARLVLGGALCWSFAPLLQIVSMLVVLRWLHNAQTPTLRSLELFLWGHGPWSFWLLGVAGICCFVSPLRCYAWALEPGAARFLALLVPLAWSNAVTFGFLRGGLRMSPSRSALGILLHGAMIWGFVLAFFLVSGQLWFRIIGRPA